MDAAGATPIEPPGSDSDLPAALGRPRSRLTPLGELQLLEAHRRGEARATAELLGAYQRRIYTICFRMLGSAEDASDLTQDALVKVLEGLDTYDGRSSLSTWIIRVAMNCCLSHLRKQKLRRHRSLDVPPGRDPLGVPNPAGARAELSPLARVEQAEVQSILLRALGGLDPEMRSVLVLRDFQELDYQKISEVLNVPVGTVKSRLFRARAALRTAAEWQLGHASGEQE